MKNKRKPDPYDIAQIYAEMELYLVASMIRNYERHLKEQKKLGFKWEQWQLIQLRRIHQFRKEARRIIRGSSKAVKGAAKQLLIESYGAGKGKVEALIEAVAGDLDKAEHAIFRFADDVYRQTIFRAQMYLDTGTMTLRQAVDLATKDFLDQGINCIEYKDGRRAHIASYVEMALRTASQRATFMADGEKRDRWGVHTIFVSAHANACDLCIPWQGKVLIDDVYSSGIRPRDGFYPLLSEAMDKGLLHPNCRHTLATYFPGVTQLPKVPDEATARANYKAEQKQRYMERQVRRWKRREAGSLDAENVNRAAAKVKEWQGRLREHLKENPQLRRDYWRERLPRDIDAGSSDDIISSREWLKAPFSTEKRFEKHIKDHLKEYGGLSPQEYLNTARDLLAAPLSEDVEGFVDKEGYVYKYRKSTNDFAVGRPDGRISTVFKPVDAYEYWLHEKEKRKGK